VSSSPPQVRPFSSRPWERCPPLPFDPCSSVSTIAPNYVADWCDKKAPAGYEAFRTALADYRAAIGEFQLTENDVIRDLGESCRPDLGKPANPAEVDLIVGRLSYSRPLLDRANDARNRMLTALPKAFAGDPQAPAVGVDIRALGTVISNYGSGISNLEETSKLWAACSSEQTWQVANDALLGDRIAFANNGTQSIQIAADIQMAFQATQDACSAVKVRERIPTNQIKKAGDPQTRKAGGTALTYPKTLNVGKKPVKLPVNVKTPGSGYTTVTVSRGSKGIVATGGWADPGTFGLLMTVPGKTKPGKVTLAVTQEGGPGVEATVRLR